MIYTTNTKQMEDALFSQWDEFDDYNEDYSTLIEKLNNEDSFRSFGDALLFFLQKNQPELTAETAIEYIEKMCTETGVEKSDIASTNTFKSWFKGGPRPKKGDDSRKSMFALAFVLKLSPDETAELFHKVYLDRAFDYRNKNEIIYYYCLKNQKTWIDANRLIGSVKYNNQKNIDATVYTSQIKSDVVEIVDEADLLSYIGNHGHNFEKKSVSAKQTVEKLLSEARTFAKMDDIAVERMAYKNGKEEPVYKERFEGYNKDSLNFTYEVITELCVSGEKGTKTLFKNSRLPKEIKNRFPEAATLSKKELTYEELRKLIILLASYSFWTKLMKQHKLIDINDYIEEINVYLDESGLSLMYYGNPYDWMFLFCALSDHPLDTFRGLLTEVLEE